MHGAQRMRILVLLIWTAGAGGIWIVANAALNPGVSESDVQECLEERFIPADECEETLAMLEADDEPVLGLGSLFLIWVTVSLLLWLVTQPRAGNSA
jgi:hypothetical protein